MQKQAKRIFWNAMLLTAASLLMRTVGVGFQVYISNRAGAEAMGLFSLMGGVYGFALTLATSGIHLGVTRVITEAIGKEQPERVLPTMRRAVCYALTFGIIAALLLLFFAEPIGVLWLKDTRTVTSLRLFGITLPLISLSSSMSGYFTAVRRVYKNATVQVLEQAVKIMASMWLLAMLASDDIEKTCCALVLGGAVAEITSFFIELTLYLLDSRRFRAYQKSKNDASEGRKLIKISLPIALTAYIRSGLLTLQHILIPEGLRNSGASHSHALAAYGSIQSMALPVILYPAALISSFSGLLVPELAECNVRHSEKRICYMISRVWFFAMIFSVGVAGILICFSAEIGAALYPNTDAGIYIRRLAPLIPIMYLDTATDAMMKGLGEQLFSMKINIADALISVILVWCLIPTYGIEGYFISVYFSEIFNTVLSITHLLTISKTPVRLFKWVYKPLFCIVCATCTVRILLCFFSPAFFGTALSITWHILAVVILYLLFLFLTGCIDHDDREWIRSLFKRDNHESV